MNPKSARGTGRRVVRVHPNLLQASAELELVVADHEEALSMTWYVRVSRPCG